MTWLILLLALLLRLPLLTQSLWLDEAIEALALQGYYGPLSSYSLSDFQPPLYHYLLKLWTNLAGYSPLALRLPSLLAGICLVAVVIRLATLLSTPRVGLLAGVLVATNPLLIYYSQEGRAYMLTTFLCALSFFALAKLLKQQRSTPLDQALYLLSTALMLWTSYLSSFVALLQFAYLLAHRRLKLAVLPLLALLSLLFWLPPFLHSLSLGMGDAAANPEWATVVGGASSKAAVLTFVKFALGRISFSPPPVYKGVVLALLSLHLIILRRARLVHPLIPLALSTLIPSFLISFFVPAYSYTRVLFVLPFYLLLLALGLSYSKRLASVVLVSTQLAALLVFWLTPRFHREDWRGVVQYLNRQQGVVGMASLDQSPPLVYYGLHLPLIEPAHNPIPREVNIYYLRYAEDIFDPSGIGRTKLIEAGYTRQEQVSFNNIPLEIYAHRP